MYLIAFPLLLIPFALFNMIVFLLDLPLTDTVATVPLMSRRMLPLTSGELLVAAGILLLYLEVLKAARLGGKGVMDHLLSLLLFAAMAAELALVARAATPALLLLAVLGFVDMIIGISVPARRRPREIAIEGPDHAPV
jgi:hypothetical protein